MADTRRAAVAAIALSMVACVGIIDNSGIDEDDAGHVGTGATSGTTVTGSTAGPTSSTTGSSTTDSTTTGPSTTGPSTSSTSTGPTTSSSTTSSGSSGGAGGSDPGSGGPTTGSGGMGGSSVGSGGSGGAGGSGHPDAGLGGRGGTGGAAGARPDAGMGGSSVGGATFTQVKAILQRDCTSCHSNFTTYNTVMTHSVSNCGGDTLAKANDAANSAFLELVQGQCGSFLMPRGCRTAPCISQSDIDTFTAWINAGAPNN
jgi:hypothetical protein